MTDRGGGPRPTSLGTVANERQRKDSAGDHIHLPIITSSAFPSNYLPACSLWPVGEGSLRRSYHLSVVLDVAGTIDQS